ncbi:MAG: class I SAM-dependent methyltransferase [Candidatus Omnitrophica bacterium]|nr:class I SAM-dependent methyltransferase [Candidatus Omnitrophota bacterium]
MPRIEAINILFKRTKLFIQDPRKFIQDARRFLRPVPGEYRKWSSMSLKDWLLYHQKEIVFDKCHWMGKRAFKNPFDAWIYQEIIYEVKPDLIIEIGSAEGGSTLYFAHLLDIIGKGKIVSIDIERSKFNVRHRRIDVITGDSSSPETVAKVSRLCRGRSVMVIHDGDHSKGQVLKDLKAYSNFVSMGSYLIVEDGIIDLFKPGDGIGTYVDGPYNAVNDFLEDHPNFIVDKERERYIMTYNPRGFLKRIK